MRMLIFSDSHGVTGYMKRAISLHGRRADAVIHLGDGAGDLMSVRAEYPDLAFYAVAGNCDPEIVRSMYDIDFTSDFSFDGVRVYACHGHTCGVKYGTEKLVFDAAKKNCRVALFGHTHEPYNKYERMGDSGIYVFNPGSVGMPYAGGISYGILEIKDGSILLSHGTL
ncbi:MAG: YfcE family phosphodiesterase [Clostridiales bacterium]|nr:YfcE family phosphodiesterase [Clostridiales bacterium]